MLNIFLQPLCSDDFYPLPIAFTNPDGTPKDLSGKTLGLTVKDEPMDSDDVTKARFYQNIFGDITGQVVFAIRGLGAGLYWIDVKIWTTSAVPSDRQTVIPPVQMKIIQSVTTRST